MFAALQADKNEPDSIVPSVLLDTCCAANQLAKVRHALHTSQGGATHWPGTKLSSFRPSEQMYNRCVVFMMPHKDPNCVQSLLLRHLLLAVAAA
jgi:hypothetical protein